MHESPNPTTLLFTDIEGSTRLWEQEGANMSVALAEHDRLSRAAVSAHRGTIVKMTGDGMYAAFADPADALAATVALQRSLDGLATTGPVALRVRAGLHAGLVERRDEDLFGSPVNRAARIMKAAHGGQILVSQAVVDCTRERLPDGVSLRDLGAVRLRDLSTSEHVYQLVHPDLRQDFPALRSLEATPNNLPQQATSFIGREAELAEAKRLLEGTRLLTLLGMGGLGKTRLSLQIAADVLDGYPDGVWFVDLAPIRDPSLVPNATGHVLGIREEAGKPVTQSLCEHLREHKLLIVLDNCEHLVDACARLADALLRGIPGVRILATSREALHIQGEQTYPVLPLRVPDRKAGAEALLRSDAGQLFIERARLQRPNFTVTEEDVPGVAELCARLDGIPLALELAAARLRSLSVADINARLHDRFKLLTGGSRVALERQQTLRALVNWSYDLLREDEQIVLDRLSVFVGGFDLQAAEAVCGADPIAAEDVLDLVNSLVEKSLIMVEQEGRASRYGLLETIKEFAHEHLTKRSRSDLQETIREFASERLRERDDVAATAARHCEYYFALAKTARPRLEGPEHAEWTRRLEVELDNLRAAIALALAGGVDPVLAVKLEVALMTFRILRGYSTEARNNVRAALALPSLREPNVARGHALYLAGVFATNQGDYGEAMKMLDECLAIRRSLGAPNDTAATLSTLSTLHLRLGEVARARAAEEEAIALFRAQGNALGEAVGLLNLGEIAVRQDDDAAASKLFLECLGLARNIRHAELEGECERNLGELALAARDLPGARARFTRSLEICRGAEDKRNEAIALWCLGKADVLAGDPASARARFADALRTFEVSQMSSEALDCLEDFAALMQTSARPDLAARAHSATVAIRERLAIPRLHRAEPSRLASIEAARAALGEEAFDAAWADGATWALDDAIDAALAFADEQALTA
ncbi:MAG TPA: tetratricopeptide repeat protein [Casimicrobiaceae bacterium]|nr:tetratricopeptide repeat protein [Casimicrobiaceae bacterium]